MIGRNKRRPGRSLFDDWIATSALKPATVVLRDKGANRITDDAAEGEDNGQEDQRRSEVHTQLTRFAAPGI